MPGPFDYSSQLDNPLQSFMQGVQVVDVMRQRQAQQEQAIAMQRRKHAMQEAMGTLAADRSPQNVSRVLTMFPELKESIQASQASLDDAQKKADRSFYGQILMYRAAGMEDRADALMRERVDALKNTQGREAEAQSAQAMYDAYKANPAMADPTIAMYLQTTDPEFYKQVSEKSELTTFQKNLTAAGIDPNSPRGQELSMQYAQRQADPIIELETPSGGKFVGPYSEYQQRYSGGGAKAGPPAGAVSGGYKFKGGDPNDRKNWEPVGGGSGNATGGFR